jgi:hypothetical protein
MDVRMMVLVTAAMVVERLAPAGQFVARTIGVIAMVAGMLLFVRAAGFG